MDNREIIRKFFGLGSASAINIAVLTLMSLLVAKFLTVESFGITRSITAYMVVLVMLGHFTFHDALASFVSREQRDEDRNKYFASATWLVVVNSSLLSLISYILIKYTGLWSGNLQSSFAIAVLFLPFAALAITYNSALQAIGEYRGLMIVTILTAVIPFCLILPLSYNYELIGWVSGRVVSFVLLTLVSSYFVFRYLRALKFNVRAFKKLFSFARVQIFSGVLSLVLLSADIIMLERLTDDISDVAYYGLAAFFAKSLMFIPSVFGRLYFKQIADFSIGITTKNKIVEFLFVVSIVCLILSIVIYFIGPIVIDYIYGESYSQSSDILKIMAYGIVFMGLWHAISTVNIATNKPARSLYVSATGSIAALVLMWFLIPEYGGVGAAWSMVVANLIGVCVGVMAIINDCLSRIGKC